MLYRDFVSLIVPPLADFCYLFEVKDDRMKQSLYDKHNPNILNLFTPYITK
ncbi:hypothetical protein HFN_1085 [Helicobacter fennelliae MRY12-0050]|uniref:Uncharacterized protein n=1 Tax=Helicobacter fennelliae MRY12-0050 TaxID=1325130 RepID=T1D0V5_9HELI|nr:hypothetical protein HFN_1085 [Helicobacter fennelliae MRY12-0050]